MAVTTAPFTNANLTATIPQIWTDIINEAQFPQFVLQRFVQDLSPYVLEGGRVAHVPNIYTNLFTVSTQSTQGAEIDTNNPAQVDTTLTINTHKYCAYIIGDADMAQLAKKYDLNMKYAEESSKLLMQALEDDLFGLYTGLTTTVGAGTAAIDDLSVRQAIRTMVGLNWNTDELAFFFHPQVFYDQLIGLSKIAPNYSGNFDVIKTGLLGNPVRAMSKGKVYGVDVFVSPRVKTVTTTCKNLLLHPSAFGFATQTMGGSKVRVQMEYQLRNLGTLSVVDISYGVATLRADAGVVLNFLTAGTVA